MTLYGFFHNSDTHESAPSLVSLHRTKAGAWRAMWRYQWDRWIEQRYDLSHTHWAGHGMKFQREKYFTDHTAMWGEASHIEPVRVLE